ncbi:MAG: hypothetical protein ABTQ34_04705 [Bdellovibrionales bacterium]
MQREKIYTETRQALISGFQHVIEAVCASSPEKLAEEMKKASACLEPISPPEFCVPGASFGLGLLAEHMARTILDKAEPNEKQQAYSAAAKNFSIAAKYYKCSAVMPDYLQDFTPSCAKIALADLYHHGCLGKKDELRAFVLRKSAAEDGFAEAQIHLAKCYYNGWGTEPSLPKALFWMSAAAGQQGVTA